MTADMDEVAIAGVRRLSMDAVHRAQSVRTMGAFSLGDVEGTLGFIPGGIADAARRARDRGVTG